MQKRWVLTDVASVEVHARWRDAPALSLKWMKVILVNIVAIHPQKHSVLQSRPTDSQLMPAMVTEDQSSNSGSISSTKRKEAWKDKRLGWIEDPKRQTGIYNSIIEQFYNSYWSYYPHVDQFRRAFIM